MPSLFNDDLPSFEEARAQTRNEYEAMAYMGQQTMHASRQMFLEAAEGPKMIGVEIEWQGPEMRISDTQVTFKTPHWVTRRQWWRMRLVRLLADILKLLCILSFVSVAIFFFITLIKTVAIILGERTIKWAGIEILVGVALVLFGLYKSVDKLGKWGVPPEAQWVTQRVFAIRRIRKLSKTDIHRIELNWNEH